MIIGNWKMNTLHHEAQSLAQSIAQLPVPSTTRVGICPPVIWQQTVKSALTDSSVMVGLQDCVGDPVGAQTGCVNAAMAHDAGCEFVVLGHSERRQRFSETTETLVPALQAVLEAGMFPILCVGETLEAREQGRAEQVVSEQLTPVLTAGLDLDGLVVAYEPVWAIGSGLSAKQSDIDAMHSAIRIQLKRDDAVVLYGGSVSPESAPHIFASPAVSGALVGGASLDFEKFAAIVAAWEQK
jgi:triosephosphate isomerase